MMVNRASILAARLQRILYRECMKCAVSDIKQNVCHNSKTYTLVVLLSEYGCHRWHQLDLPLLFVDELVLVVAIQQLNWL
jgi:hypothetical protein